MSANEQTDYTDLKEQLVCTAHPYTWREIEESGGVLPPSTAGVYAWFFTRLAGLVPVDGCEPRDGRVLLYVGIARDKPTGNNTLSYRIRQHFTETAQQSTLRSTLGYLLEGQLGTVMRRVVPTGESWNYAQAESALTGWLENHAAVSWISLEPPDNKRLEQFLIETTDLPLNKARNQKHPFYTRLDDLRDQAWKQAKRLPICRCVFRCGSCGQTLKPKGNSNRPKPGRCPARSQGGHNWGQPNWEDVPEETPRLEFLLDPS